MRLTEIVQQLALKNLTSDLDIDETLEVSAGHVSDLLSDVLANAPTGGILVTIQVHMNVIAVAVHADVQAVIFAAGMQPDEAVIQRAATENLLLFTTERSTFDVVGALYALGLRGRQA